MAGTTVSQQTAHAARAVVNGLQDAFNRHDPDALSEYFAEQAAWTTVMGKRLGGRLEIAEFGRQTIDMLRDSYARYEVVRELAIGEDLVAVNVLQTPTDREGRAVAGPSATALYIIGRQADGWKIVAGQNTFLPAPE